MSLIQDISPVVKDIFDIFITLTTSSVEREVKIVKRRFTRWMLMVMLYSFALLLVIISLIILSWGLFVLLAMTVSPYSAAFIIGGTIFVVGTVLMFMVVLNLMK